MKWRIKSLIFAFGALYLFLIFCLYNLQIQKSTYYLSKVEAQEEASGVLQAPRGDIYFTDKNNAFVPAAFDKDFPMIYADPKEVQQEIQKSGESIETPCSRAAWRRLNR